MYNVNEEPQDGDENVVEETFDDENDIPGR